MIVSRFVGPVAFVVAAVLSLTLAAGLPASAVDDLQNDEISPSPICLGQEFVISGSHWEPGPYAVAITDDDDVSLLDPSADPQFVVAGDGTFSATFTARADAPAGPYPNAVYAPLGQDTWQEFDSSVIVEDCTPTELTAATPVITGSAVVGTKLTANRGTWTSGTAFAYQWYANGQPITGAIQGTFTPTTAQNGAALTVTVTGTKAGYATASRTSRASLRVMRASTPTITGRVSVGSTLTAKPGTWTSGTSFGYQWYANGKAISGATKSTLKLSSGQRDKAITVKVTGRKSGHTTVARTSNKTGKAGVSGSVKVSGTPIAGATLTAQRGTWTSGTKFTYQWLADGQAISGATKSTLKLGSGQVGKKITVRVTGRKSGYATASKNSAATARVARATTPTISGSPWVTRTLTAKSGTWTPGARLSYQWFADGRAISGATKPTLRLTSGLAGKKITVRVTGRKAGHPTVVRTSRATAIVKYPARTTPTSAWNCPSWAPIKGNANSGIYHVRGGQYYTRTKPEECFRTETAARAGGYRKSKR